jgi:hypothetical protein
MSAMIDVIKRVCFFLYDEFFFPNIENLLLV